MQRSVLTSPAKTNETTTHLISGSVFELAKNPRLRDWLAEDWSRADQAIEEFLRFVSPVQFSKPRFIRQDVELSGVRLKRARFGSLADILVVQAYRADPASEVLYKRTPHRPVFSRPSTPYKKLPT